MQHNIKTLARYFRGKYALKNLIIWSLIFWFWVPWIKGSRLYILGIHELKTTALSKTNVSCSEFICLLLTVNTHLLHFCNMFICHSVTSWRHKAVLLAYILNNNVKLEQTKEIPHYNPTTTMKLWMCSHNLSNKFTVCHHICHCSTTNALELALGCP